MESALVIAAVLISAPGLAIGDWSDNFDRYPNGTSLHGVGGWKGWDNNPAYTAYVTDAEALSTPHSVEIADLSDLVHEYDIAWGLWVVTAWQFIPLDYWDSSDHYFIVLSTYDDDGGQTGTRWCVQMGFRGLDDAIHIDAGSSSPIVIWGLMTRGEWKEIRCVIDLDNDWVDLYYDDVWMAGYVYHLGVFGSCLDGPRTIRALDLYANFGSEVYYDDIALTAARGDVNCDGRINAFDIDPFVLALTDPAGYAAVHSNCGIVTADINCDGVADWLDIDGFVECLITGQWSLCP